MKVGWRDRCRAVLWHLGLMDSVRLFHKDVDVALYPSYAAAVKHPVSLATVNARLDAGRYKNAAAFAVDMRLIFENCKSFNADGSNVWFEAVRKAFWFEKYYADWVICEFNEGLENALQPRSRPPWDHATPDAVIREEDDDDDGGDDKPRKKGAPA